jgi:type IV secretory pathway VirB2 component (pilin)
MAFGLKFCTRVVNGIMQLCSLLCVVVFANPDSAFALNIYTDAPTCSAGQVPSLTWYGWSCVAGTPASPVGVAPTCPTGETAVLEGSSWTCELNSTPDAQTQISSINFLASVENSYATYCPTGTTLVLSPTTTGNQVTGASVLCIASSVMTSNIQDLALESEGFAEYNSLAQEITATAQAEVAAAALATAEATAVAVSRADSNNIGGVLCTVAQWFTGNIGKGMALSCMSILGFGIILGKVSFKPALFVCTGTAIIFGASTIIATANPVYGSIGCYVWKTHIVAGQVRGPSWQLP